MSDVLEKHGGKVNIGGRNISSLRFADDMDTLAEEEQELEAKISTEKTKLMTNSANGIQKER